MPKSTVFVCNNIFGYLVVKRTGIYSSFWPIFSQNIGIYGGFII